MRNASTRNTTISLSSDMKNADQSFPSSSSQAIARKPYSLKSAGTGQNGISSNFDEVTFLRLPEVKKITGLSKSSLYALIQEKSFPAPVRLGARTVAWVRSEIRQWALDRIRASR
jgi:prophage regulatory protein